MKKINVSLSFLRRLGFFVFIFLIFALSKSAFAATPVLSMVIENATNVRLTVSNADPYATISLYEKSGNSGLWTSITNFGTTDQSGYYSTIFGLGQNPPSSIDYYVIINSKSSDIKTLYPSQGCGGSCSGGTIYLSQNSLNLEVNQSQNIYVYGGASYYLNNNTNPSVASATLSGSTLQVYGYSTGSTTLTICAYNSSCVTAYVSVSETSTGTLSFSQTNPNLNIGQTLQLSVFGGSGSYYLSSTSNSSVLSATLTGNQLTLYGQNTGYSQVTVCDYSSRCATLYVSVNQQGSGYQNLSFSETNPSIIVGQSRQISIYSTTASPNYYVANNTNTTVASATISGNTLNLYGLATGSSSLTICQTGAVCGYLYVTVTQYTDYTSSYPLITASALPLAYSGQYYSYQLPVSGGTSPYVFTVSAGSLPTGLSLNSSGLIYGTPVCGSYPTLTFQVRDSSNRISSKDYTFQIANCPQYYPTQPTPVYPYPAQAPSLYKNGQLINDSGTVYIVYKNTKTGFTSASAFEGLGYKWESVLNASTSSLMPSSYLVISPLSQHPWGSWILNGNTVYFVHESGLIPISNYDIFLNNGGDSAKLVPANTYDLNLSLQSLMAYNDSRLR